MSYKRWIAFYISNRKINPVCKSHHSIIAIHNLNWRDQDGDFIANNRLGTALQTTSPEAKFSKSPRPFKGTSTNTNVDWKGSYPGWLHLQHNLLFKTKPEAYKLFRSSSFTEEGSLQKCAIIVTRFSSRWFCWAFLDATAADKLYIYRLQANKLMWERSSPPYRNREKSREIRSNSNLWHQKRLWNVWITTKTTLTNSST